MISRGLEYRNKKCWTVRYPWIKEADKVPSNVSYLLTNLGTRYSGLHGGQIQDMVYR